MGSPSKKQLSKKQLQDIARPYAHKALLKAAELIYKADNDSVKLGAIKLILAKVLPDLRATEIDGALALKLQHVIKLPTESNLDTTSRTTDRSTKES